MKGYSSRVYFLWRAKAIGGSELKRRGFKAIHMGGLLDVFPPTVIMCVEHLQKFAVFIQFNV